MSSLGTRQTCVIRLDDCVRNVESFVYVTHHVFTYGEHDLDFVDDYVAFHQVASYLSSQDFGLVLVNNNA